MTKLVVARVNPWQRSFTAHVDSEIWFRRDSLTVAELDGLKEALTVPNPEYESAKRMRLDLRGIVQEFQLWREDSVFFYIPRGYAVKLRKGVESLNRELEWLSDRETRDVDLSSWSSPELRPHQAPCVEKMLKTQQGIVQAPPGSGKTVTVLEAIRRSSQRSLVIVDKTNIAQQWVDRARQHFGAELGLIGDGVWDAKDVTVAMQQTLWSQRHELSAAGFFQEWGFVCLDECHHVPAHTYAEIVGRFAAKYRFGVSATPNRNDGMLPVAVAVLGPIFHTTSREEGREAGFLVEPTVQIVYTGWDHESWPTFSHDEGECKICGKEKPHFHRSNYPAVVAAIPRSEERNDLVASCVARNRGRAQLVLSDRVEHLKRLYTVCLEAGVPGDTMAMLTGAEDRLERVAICDKADAGDVVLFSTIADEALDVPRLDTLHLTFPMRSTAKLEQRLGRIERAHPRKLDAVVYDYVDECRVLASQFRTRARHYRKLGISVKTSEAVVL